MSTTTAVSILQLCEACRSTGRRICACCGDSSSIDIASSCATCLSLQLLDHAANHHHHHPSPPAPRPPLPPGTVHEFQFFGRQEEEEEEEDPNVAASCWLLDNINWSSRPADEAAASDPPQGSYWRKTVDGFPVSQLRSPGPSLEMSVLGVQSAISPLAESSISANTTEALEGGMTEREARILRYREKKRNRKFEKQIRYASRKAYAEKRPRIKGRFTKDKNSKPSATAPHQNNPQRNFLALG